MGTADFAMKAVALGGVCWVLAAGAVVALVPDHHAISWFSGVSLAIALLAARRSLGRRASVDAAHARPDDAGMTLSRWAERAESQIAWSDSSRADWDRRVRPMLARQFEFATRQPRARNPAALAVTGRILFGDELWRWVDPDNISRTGAQERGPGRAVLIGIIERLERL
ncbi:hypothetical protein [Mycolicibacterium helvum]|uniref:Uncharacterized protein n=1 Tax=Mycolicibacterium helvum TaxID=1534349 RepID=A0A7I7TC64_9MYCO|nr:hypothetical protein [Mycolicibacterium helvum]BBY66872.1 hypothetical protein MHEL_51150 [Mycolicibacterium helvum]